MQGGWYTAHVCHIFPFSVLSLTWIQITEFNFAPGPASPLSLSANTGGGHFSSSTCSEVIRVQSPKWSERERPAASRTSALSRLLRLNCPTEKMKVFVAALFLLLLSLSTASASVSRSQASESTCPCRAVMSKGTGAAGSERCQISVIILGASPPPACLAAILKLSPS